jgi:hypothetical protein
VHVNGSFGFGYLDAVDADADAEVEGEGGSNFFLFASVCTATTTLFVGRVGFKAVPTDDGVGVTFATDGEVVSLTNIINCI